MPETPGTDPAAAIAAHLAGRRDQKVLVVLDNCEHLAESAAALTEYLLAECPALSVLATSREPLGVEGEWSWPVPPLDRQQAVQLFSDRARLVAPNFAITDANRAKVAELCGKLDGLPLAIELAAARMRILSVRQLTERLGDVFDVLTGGARSAPARHQALRATLDWSHDLLTTQERVVFRRLAVFTGGFELAAAETVTAFGEIRPGQVLDLVARLADKSLLVADRSRERYQMLATIHEYATERLAAAAERDQARRAHLAYYTEFAEQAGARLERAAAADLEAALDGLDAERANLRVGHRLRQRERRRRRRPADRRPARQVRLPARALQRDTAVDGPGGGGRPDRVAAAASQGAVRQRPAGAVAVRLRAGRAQARRRPAALPRARRRRRDGVLPAGARQRRPRAGPVRPFRAVARGGPRAGQDGVG